MRLKNRERGQGATEYLLMLAAVLVIVAVAIYYVTRAGGYPVVSMNAAPAGENSDQIMITVLSGSIPSGQWSYYVGPTPSGSSTNFIPGTGALAAPSVTLGTYGSGTWYVNIKHTGTGHIYFNPDQIVSLP
jgi:hypothetical protein